MGLVLLDALVRLLALLGQLHSGHGHGCGWWGVGTGGEGEGVPEGSGKSDKSWVDFPGVNSVDD